jgi:hypothetical protein
LSYLAGWAFVVGNTAPCAAMARIIRWRTRDHRDAD